MEALVSYLWLSFGALCGSVFIIICCAVVATTLMEIGKKGGIQKVKR